MPGYADLRRAVRAAGLLDRTYGYYAALGVGLVLGLVLVGSLLWVAPVAGTILGVPVLAFLVVQIGMLAHDAGHHQVFERPSANRLLGLIARPVCLALSYEQWVSSHNTHHSRTNEIERDPDMSHPFLVFTHEQAVARKGIARWAVRYQAYLYPVVAVYAGIGLRLEAWAYVLRHLKRAGPRLELALMVVGLGLWLGLPSLLLGPERWLPVFGLAQLIVGPYLVWLFAPNHKGMPVIPVGDKRRFGFLEQQVLTARSVRGGRVLDVLYGGLNYQIEHHLFPTMPRRKLPECQRLVRAFCAEIGLSYAEVGTVEAYRSVLRELDAIGRGGSAPVLVATALPARPAPPASR